MKNGINVLSLFDGMSCGQIALERSGIKVNEYYASEIDKYAIKVALSNYPNTVQLGSVVDLDDFVVEAILPKIDLLIGGSPCQGFSFAGKQLNFEDPRSKLFFEYVRLLETLRKTNPEIKFLLENVKMKKESQDIISGYLGVEPIAINSALVSAQTRKRIYWTNIAPLEIPKDRNILLKDIISDDFYVDRDKSRCIISSIGRTTKREYFTKNQGQMVFDKKTNLPRKVTPLECERLQTVPDNYTDSVSNCQRYKMLGNGWTIDVIAHIFSSWKQN